MAKTISPNALAGAIGKELKLYSEDVRERVDAAGNKAIKKLVKLTRATAPVLSGSFQSNITSKRVKGVSGDSFIWGVKAPDHRVTHLVVHGHATPKGGRTWANPFLKDAMDAVLPEYEKDVEEAVKP